MSYNNEKSLNFSGNNLKGLEFFEKASNQFKNTSVELKMSSKSLLIFEKVSDF
jgi:hypothetical protein